MAKKMVDTPLLDQLQSGPWPSFVTGLKRLVDDNDMMVGMKKPRNGLNKKKNPPDSIFPQRVGAAWCLPFFIYRMW